MNTTIVLHNQEKVISIKSNTVRAGWWSNLFRANPDAVDALSGTGEFAGEGVLEGEGGRASIKDVPTMGIGDSLLYAFKVLLWGILNLVHLLVLLSALIFDKVVGPDLFDTLLRNNGSVYVAWAMVRDFLNLFFMLALLFSAFSTIFQVEKYHLRKIIILLVVMALLVNFSYPITLFVIDLSNSAMYFFISLIPHTNSVVSQSALVAKMTEIGMLSKNIMEKADIPALLLSIIFQFIFIYFLFSLS